MKTIYYLGTIPEETVDAAGKIELKEVSTENMAWNPYFTDRDFHIFVPITNKSEE